MFLTFSGTMAITGIVFDKFLVEKLKDIEAPLKINSSISVTDVSKEKSPEKDKAMLRFDFVFGLDYTPKQAVVELKGHILFSEKEKEIERIYSGWKKTRKIEPSLMERVMNAVLLRCNIKALLLSQELGLPPHIPMPTLAAKAKTNYMG